MSLFSANLLRENNVNKRKRAASSTSDEKNPLGLSYKAQPPTPAVYQSLLASCAPCGAVGFL